MQIIRPLFALLLLGSASLVQALEVTPYSAAALALAQAADKPVALHFHADWCPTCRAQGKSLSTLSTERDLDITVLTVDYDKESDLKKRFRVNSQSTVVVLKGEQERGRVIGESSVDGLRQVLKSGL